MSTLTPSVVVLDTLNDVANVSTKKIWTRQRVYTDVVQFTWSVYSSALRGLGSARGGLNHCHGKLRYLGSKDPIAMLA